MKQSELNKILEEHNLYITSRGEKGVKANLRGANLFEADLPDLTFIVMGEKYFISICNGEYVMAGCQNNTIEERFNFSKYDIAEMDGKNALKFYPRLLDIINFYVPNEFKKPEWVK